MNVMTLLMERIDDELQDACDYAKLALEYRATDPETASLFARLSGEETTHATALHDCVLGHMEAYRQKDLEVPVAIMAVYEYSHDQQIEKAERVKRYQSMYRKS